MGVRFVLNGEGVEVDDGEPHVTLLQWLRASGRTGSKEGCAEGECGACAVALVRRDARGRVRFESVNSCLVPLAAAGGHTIVTVEGVAARDGALHPVQRAMVDTGGSQCGYCTPGFVVSLFCEYYRPGRLDFDPESIGGNLCRCTGYRPIADAARALPRAVHPRPPPAPPLAPVLRRASRAAALRAAARAWRCSGAAWRNAPEPCSSPAAPTSWSTPTRDISVSPRSSRSRRCPSCARFAAGPTEISIGAGLTLAEIEERLGHGAVDDVPMLVAALAAVLVAADPQPRDAGRQPGDRVADRRFAAGAARARRRGDAGGTARRAPPAARASSSPATARRRWRRTRSSPAFICRARCRRCSVSTRSASACSTTSRRWRRPSRWISRRDGRVERLRLAYGGVAATPIRAPRRRDAGGRPALESRDRRRDRSARSRTVGTPIGDHRGSAAYRRAMIGRLFEKFFAEVAHGAEAAR